MNELMELRQLAQQTDNQKAVSLYNKVDKEIERLLKDNKLLQDMDKILRNENTNLKLKNKRLNNIINELFEYLKENSKQPELFESDRYYEDVLDKLQELKGSEKE